MVMPALAMFLGLSSGLLVALGWRARAACAVMLLPLAAAIYLCPPADAAVAGLLFGAAAAVPCAWGRFPFNRRFERVIVASQALLSAALAATAAWVWPDRAPAWGLVIFPVTIVVLAALPTMSGGRVANVLLPVAQQSATLVHVGRLGLPVVSALVAVWAAIPIALLSGWPPSRPSATAAAVATVLAAVVLAFGRFRLGRAVRAASRASTVRVAAVATDVDPVGCQDALPGQQARGHLAEVIAAYDPLVRQALGSGAGLVVLPESAAWASNSGEREEWVDVLRRWAGQGAATIVAGLFDQQERRNQLVIVGPGGRLLSTYDKRHPVAAGESVNAGHAGPAAISDPLPLSAAICYDLDFSDLLRPVRRQGGILAAPTNDWKEYADLHRQAAVWVPVSTRTSLVRAASHGISAIIDPAGRTLAEASSFDGPVVLVADVPVGHPASTVHRARVLDTSSGTTSGTTSGTASSA